MQKPQLYVLARSESGKRQDLVFGDFSCCQPGSRFKRDVRIYGDELWVVAKVYTPEEQNLIDALTLVFGNKGFERLAGLFEIR